ncbi:MAG: sensor histidine kinase [Caldithrix sp.]|nr:sensor histidine kinase [Caldithrix sp.]
MNAPHKKIYLTIVVLLIVVISVLHYQTSTTKWQFHLVYMQSYFIPILLAAFQFGVRGGLGAALAVSAIYLPHVMLQWGGLIENNLMRFMQLVLYNVLGFLTGLKAQGEQKEKEKYQKTAENLEHSLKQLKEQSERISDMEEQLRNTDRLATIGELTASLAHEVRNPLGSIRGAVEIIRDAVPRDVKKMEFFDILINDTQRLNEVVENYLSFAKHKPKQLVDFSVQETINNIILMLGARARKSNIRFETHMPQHPLIIKGDPNHLWQAVMNVSLNAIQAMPEGGVVKIIAEPFDSGYYAENKHVNTEQKSETVRLMIQDEGVGIKTEQQKAIFKPFYTTKQEGSGLGLSIVKRIAEENDWQLQVKSKLHKGTEFQIIIPRQQKQSE